MNSFVYPNSRTIDITEDSLVFNRFTWQNCQNRVCESDSIDYVYKKLADIVRLSGSATFVDIGAQSGLYSLYSKYFDGVRVDAYEPLPQSRKCLVENIILNNIEDRVFSYEIAVSNTKSKTVMRCPSDHTGLNTLGSTPLRFSQWDDVEVSTDTLDNLYSDRRVDFVKCDTEGWEYFVLQGGLSVLRRDKPDLLLEVNDTNMKQCGVTADMFFGTLRGLGYERVTTLDWENMAFSVKSI